ncbi:MAG: PAS domain S-box protein [Granulosicoccus sp.]|nr:PAS domain S-box protein [Granulosicoccus sp.]
MSNVVGDSKLHGKVICVGMDDEQLPSVFQQLSAELHIEHLQGPQRLKQQVDQGLLQCDVVLLASSVEDPIAASRLVHRFDKTIPIFILTASQSFDELRLSIMFSPLLGSEVMPWRCDDLARLPQAVSSAVERHQQRRKYLDNIASVQPKLGNLELSQPEVGHYLDRLLNQAPIGVVSLDAQGCILATNPQANRLLGINKQNVLGTALVNYFKSEGYDRFTNLLARSCVAQIFGTKSEVFERITSSNRLCCLEVSASPIAYQGERRGFMVILQDVTERERAALQRKKNEALMRTLSSALEQAADSVMITDEDRIIEYVNPAFEILTGYKKDEVIGRETHFLRSGLHDKSFYTKLWETISDGGVFRGVLVNRKKDGEKYYEEKTISGLRNTEGIITHYVSTGHDITARLDAEKAISQHQAELAHVSRLSTLGEMTSGLAHELNQPLCAITTYAQTCLRVIDGEYDKNTKLRYGLEQIVKQAELAGGILKRLRNFSRKRVIPKRCVDLRHIVNEVATLSDPELKDNGITLEIDPGEGRLQTVADPIQIEQVLLNLLRNSIDAMVDLPPDRKRISVCLRKISDQEIKATLSDCGQGCSEDIVEWLFEPFYTTKPNGLGIGLGISQSIIESHGGRLYLEGNSPSGAAFSFTLPAVDALIEEGDTLTEQH